LISRDNESWEQDLPVDTSDQNSDVCE
jgi:hypothetical protein